MNKRGPNQDQMWHCDRCDRTTEHEAGLPQYKPSGWDQLEGIRVYRKHRECKECAGKIPTLGEPEGDKTTVELEESVLQDVLKQLKSLREFRNTVQKALEAIPDKSMFPNQ